MADTFIMSTRQAAELDHAFERNGWTPAEVKQLSSGGLLAEVRKVVLGTSAIVDREQFGHIKALAEAMAPRSEATEPTADTFIRVDRAASSTYPDWMKKMMHPELEHTGPAEYDLTKVEQWLHDGQKNGKTMRGNAIYEHLKSNDMLDSCLGLADGLAIQKKGTAVFRKLYGGKAVFLWRSVVLSRDGGLYVPYLYERGDGVALSWRWLGNDWIGGYPALRFAS